jgi:protein-tyrosine phosphatase
MAEGLLRAQLASAGISAQVGSAGLLPGGVPPTPEAVAVMTERGIDITRHVSCQLTPDIARSANLVLGMTRQHVREACVGYGALLQRAFTLRELVRRGDTSGARRDDETLYTWLGRVGTGRRPNDLVGDSQVDDIPDPIGKPRPYFDQTADELDDLLGRLVRMIIGPSARVQTGGERRSGAGHHRL